MNIKYRLFALKPTDGNQRKTADERFVRMTPGYILVYTANEQPESSVRIEGDDLRRMTPGDEAWLVCCNAELILEETKAHEEEIRAALSEKIERLEKELETAAAGEEEKRGELE